MKNQTTPTGKECITYPHTHPLLSSQDGDKLVWDLISQAIEKEIQRMMKDESLTSEAFDSRLDSIRSQIDKYRTKSQRLNQELKKHNSAVRRKKELEKQNKENNPKPANGQTKGTQEL